MRRPSPDHRNGPRTTSEQIRYKNNLSVGRPLAVRGEFRPAPGELSRDECLHRLRSSERTGGDLAGREPDGGSAPVGGQRSKFALIEKQRLAVRIGTTARIAIASGRILTFCKRWQTGAADVVQLRHGVNSVSQVSSRSCSVSTYKHCIPSSKPPGCGRVEHWAPTRSRDLRYRRGSGWYPLMLLPS